MGNGPIVKNAAVLVRPEGNVGWLDRNLFDGGDQVPSLENAGAVVR